MKAGRRQKGKKKEVFRACNMLLGCMYTRILSEPETCLLKRLDRCEQQISVV